MKDTSMNNTIYFISFTILNLYNACNYNKEHSFIDWCTKLIIHFYFHTYTA